MQATDPTDAPPDWERRVDEYVAHLLARERADALALVAAVASSGADLRDVYVRLLEAAQHRIGEMWASGEISIAREHYCTAVTQQAIASLYPFVFATPTDGRRAVVACVGGELHELGARMVADFLQLDGWDTSYLSANVPPGAVLEEAVATGAHLVCLSASREESLPQVEATIASLRSERGAAVQIVVGGRPFSEDPELWRRVGADGSAGDAHGAAAVARDLVPSAR